MWASLLALRARPPAVLRYRSSAVPHFGATLKIGDKPSLVSWFGFADQRWRVCCATRPLLACARSDPRVWTTRPPRGDFYAARIHVWVCRAKTRCALCSAPPSDAAHPAGPPRLTPRPPEGGFYAARVHVWVRFLLPRTTFAMNANHRSQESA